MVMVSMVRGTNTAGDLIPNQVATKRVASSTRSPGTPDPEAQAAPDQRRPGSNQPEDLHLRPPWECSTRCDSYRNAGMTSRAKRSIERSTRG